MYNFLAVLKQEPTHEEAKKGLESIARTYYLLIISNLQKDDYEKSLTHTESFLSFLGQSETNTVESENYKKSILSKISEKQITV
jgi:hypothetical protein